MSGARADRCLDCGVPLQHGQGYCISCGTRAGPRSAQLLALLGRLRAPGPVEPAAAPQEEVRRGTTRARAQRLLQPFAPISALRLPGARISSLLVFAFLGFGVLLGAAGASNGRLVASRRPLKLLLPRSPASESRSSSSAPPSASSASSSPVEAAAPEVEATPTPTPSPTTPTAAAPTPPAASRRHAGGSPGGHGGPASAPATPATKLPPLKHVFVIMLSDEPYALTFGPGSAAPYLAHTLERRGTLLTRYDAVAHEELANELAIMSGQGPTPATAANCPDYAVISPATPAADQQLLGNGCVYPPSTQTLAGQLTARHLSARAYVQGIDEGPSTPPACSHPALGAPDPTATPPAAGESYATFRNPFVYFQSLTAAPSCTTADVGLAQLARDLARTAQTPSFSYIVPDRCHDGNPMPCSPGARAGLAPTDEFLRRVVPEITAAPAYKRDGLLVITTDEAPSGGELGDSSSCCGQPQFPNLPPPPAGLTPRGGGTVGALLLSPYISGGTTSEEPYDHFSLLRTVEDLFGLSHLGYAALPRVSAFEASIFTSSKHR